jgi:hypothetical protein
MLQKLLANWFAALKSARGGLAIIIIVLLLSGVGALQVVRSGERPDAMPLTTASGVPEKPIQKSQTVLGDKTEQTNVSSPSANTQRTADAGAPTTTSKPKSTSSGGGTPANYSVSPPPEQGPIVSNVAVSLSGGVYCSFGYTQLLYQYAFDFNNWKHKTGAVSAVWEYTVPDRTDQILDLPGFTSFSVDSGVAQYSDKTLFIGLRPHPFAYLARLHVTAPNEIYSNWITVPTGSSTC